MNFQSFSASLASASSSTLIVTPYPISKLDNIQDAVPRRARLPPAGNVLPGRMSGKGFIEPHHSHLPRRKRKVHVALPCPSIETNKSEKGQNSGSVGPPPSLEGAPMLPVDVEPSDQEQGAAVNVKQSGPLQPHVSHLPRRHSRRPARLRIALQPRTRNRRLQEVVSGSGLFVATHGEGGGDGDDEADELEEKLRNRFSGVVRLTSRRNHLNKDGPSTDAAILHLMTHPRVSEAEAGCTQLTDDQLQSGCGFLHQHLECREGLPSQERHRSVVILAPPTHAVDALSLAACYLAAVRSEREEAKELGFEEYLVDFQGGEEYNAVHRLLMRLHDLDHTSAVEEGSDDEGPGREIVKSSSFGLQEEWRGLLHWEGMHRLGNVWAPPQST